MSSAAHPLAALPPALPPPRSRPIAGTLPWSQPNRFIRAQHDVDVRAEPRTCLDANNSRCLHRQARFSHSIAALLKSKYASRRVQDMLCLIIVPAPTHPLFLVFAEIYRPKRVSARLRDGLMLAACVPFAWVTNGVPFRPAGSYADPWSCCSFRPSRPRPLFPAPFRPSPLDVALASSLVRLERSQPARR